MSCRACEGIEHQFDRENAEKELRRFHRRGPITSTRRLIDQLKMEVRQGDSLLDIGGGVGAIHHALLDAGVERAVHVDASGSYIDVARDEASKRSHAERVRFLRGDFTAIADDVPPADIVTLDRVICCYPDMESLVSRAADKSRRVFGAVYPRRAWWVRTAIVLANLKLRVEKSEFRAYFHSPAAIEARLRSKGFRRASLRRTLVWEITTFERQLQS